MKKLLLTGAAFVVVAGVASFGGAKSQAQEMRFVSIGTGGVTGVYYPAGGAICRLVNRDRKDHGIRCSVESTGGSVYNSNALRNGELEFGVVQSDIQSYAYNGEKTFEEQGPYKELRAVFSLHAEPYTVVARADAGIKNFDDLKGKRVNIGNPGSGQRGTTDIILGLKGWTTNDFALASELRAAEQSQALCDNKIDAMVYTVGHPNGSIQEATTACDAVLVNVDGPQIEALVEENSYYRMAVIPGGMYRGNPDPATTFGVGATVVTSADVSEEVVYTLVKAIFDNFDEFKSFHGAFEHLDPKEMITESISAPLHPGAIKYYKERGWM